MPALNPVVAEVTARIVERSRATRTDYLRRMDAARDNGVARAKLSCANWAHAFAGQTVADKLTAMGGQQPNVGIVTAYNDMLSAHQPFERFPAVIREAARAMATRWMAWLVEPPVASRATIMLTIDFSEMTSAIRP